MWRPNTRPGGVRDKDMYFLSKAQIAITSTTHCVLGRWYVSSRACLPQLIRWRDSGYWPSIAAIHCHVTPMGGAALAWLGGDCNNANNTNTRTTRHHWGSHGTHGSRWQPVTRLCLWLSIMIVLRFVATGYDYVPELVSRPDTNHQDAIVVNFIGWWIFCWLLRLNYTKTKLRYEGRWQNMLYKKIIISSHSYLKKCRIDNFLYCLTTSEIENITMFWLILLII